MIISGRSGNVTINLSYKPVLGTWKNTISDNLQVKGLYVESFGNILVDQCIAAEGNTQDGIFFWITIWPRAPRA